MKRRGKVGFFFRFIANTPFGKVLRGQIIGAKYYSLPALRFVLRCPPFFEGPKYLSRYGFETSKLTEFPAPDGRTAGRFLL
jgi:hypothetical protein